MGKLDQLNSKLAAQNASKTNVQGDPWGTYRRGGELYTTVNGAKVNTPQGVAQQFATAAANRKKLTEGIVAGKLATDNAQSDVQESADVMRLNMQAAQQTNQLAAMQGNQRRQTGGGAFQQKGVNANSAITGLSSATAKALGQKRKAANAANAASPLGRMNALAQYATNYDTIKRASQPLAGQQ